MDELAKALRVEYHSAQPYGTDIWQHVADTARRLILGTPQGVRRDQLKPEQRDEMDTADAAYRDMQ